MNECMPATNERKGVNCHVNLAKNDDRFYTKKEKKQIIINKNLSQCRTNTNK